MMGLFDLLQIKTQNEDAFEEELKELETQKKHIIEKIGEKFASENRYNDMSGTQYEELFHKLSKVEGEMDRLLDEGPIDNVLKGEENEGQYEGASSRKLQLRLVISGTVLFVVVCLGIGLALLYRQPKVDLGNDEPSQAVIVEGPDAATEESTVVSPQQLMEEFGLYKSNRANYENSQVLDYTKYKRYDSEITGFSFNYPSDIYNDVKMVNNQEDGDFGKIIRSITFSGSDGSTAVFSVYENGLNYKKDMDAMMEKVISSEKDKLFSPVVEKSQISKEKDNAIVIITAYADGGAEAERVYDLCRIENEKIYQMKLTYPRPVDEEEDKQKAYYSYVLYNLCGFSGAEADKLESFDEFVDGNYTNFQPTQQQKDIFWGIMDNMVTSRDLYDQQGMEYVVPVGTTKELEDILSKDPLLLQMYLKAGINKDNENIQSERFACIVDQGDGTNKMYLKSEIGKEEFEEFYSKAVGEKNLLGGSLAYAKTFFRDMFSLELDVNSVMQDNPSVYPEGASLLLYSPSYNELVYASGYGNRNRVDGPEDYDYNEELQCFDYHFGPVYELTPGDLNWQQKRDEEDPGNGIYIAHIRPYLNNSLGFKLLGIERVE
ncbi:MULTISPECIES: hypothetical protein [unclassified Butyrivibrio]|uniref:hypothetical protein n=1 Tax=unclassified Butyrivibrio TaxID=2639466 RepID=UPI0012DE0BAD|nr:MULTISPECIES: hypothetical protein [unclassified Butyrivibrio]